MKAVGKTCLLKCNPLLMKTDFAIPRLEGVTKQLKTGIRRMHSNEVDEYKYFFGLFVGSIKRDKKLVFHVCGVNAEQNK